MLGFVVVVVVVVHIILNKIKTLEQKKCYNDVISRTAQLIFNTII